MTYLKKLQQVMLGSKSIAFILAGGKEERSISIAPVIPSISGCGLTFLYWSFAILVLWLSQVRTMPPRFAGLVADSLSRMHISNHVQLPANLSSTKP